MKKRLVFKKWLEVLLEIAGIMLFLAISYVSDNMMYYIVVILLLGLDVLLLNVFGRGKDE